MPVQALRGQLIVAFSLAELEQMATARLGVNWQSVCGEGCTIDEAAGALVEWAKRRGRLVELARAAAAERPQNDILAATARLMPVAVGSEAGQAEERRRAVGAAPEETERRAHGMGLEEYEPRNGVQRSLGDLNARMEALEKGQEKLQTGQEKLQQKMDAKFTVLIWALVGSVGVNFATLAGLALHAWGAR